MVGGQRMNVAKELAGKTVAVIIEDTVLRVVDDGNEVRVFPRATTRPISRTGGRGDTPAAPDSVT